MTARRILTSIGLLAVLAIAPVLISPAAAQEPAPQVISGTVQISAWLRSALEAFLAASPPSTAPFYAPTYVQDQSTSTLVSLAALQIQSAEDPWQLESRDDAPSSVIWTGTVRILADGSGSLHSLPGRSQSRRLPKLATPLDPGPGGGAYVRLPFQPGRSMMYGPRLVHGLGDYGTSGMYAVDLVGGDSLGSNVASSNVFASTAGTVDFVCSDDVSAAIRTYNSATDDHFVYAHLIDNANLELDHVFAPGGGIGSLRYGSFDDTCGWADQGDDVYHIHWMFEPSGGGYRVGQYLITLGDKKFHTASTAIGSGGWILNTITGTGVDDPGAGNTQTPNIWDGIVQAIGGVVTYMATTVLPPHTTLELLRGVTNTILLMFRLAWILVRGNLNLTIPAALLIAVINFRILLYFPQVTFWAIHVIRHIKQLLNPGG